MTSLPAPDPRPSPAASRAGGQGPPDEPADEPADGPSRVVPVAGPSMDGRFLRNPHREGALRGLDGRHTDVAAFVRADPRHDAVFARLSDLVASPRPACRDEGKAHLAIGLGCTGGQHRSVAVAEALSEALAKGGWRVSKRHRELERRAGGGGLAASGNVSWAAW